MPNRDDIHMGRITTAWKKDECFLVVAQCGLDHVYVGLPPAQRAANAHLIAAAPDLLEALKRAHSQLARMSHPDTRWEDPLMRGIRDAIAKAEGRSVGSQGTPGAMEPASPAQSEAP